MDKTKILKPWNKREFEKIGDAVFYFFHQRHVKVLYLITDDIENAYKYLKKSYTGTVVEYNDSCFTIILGFLIIELIERDIRIDFDLEDQQHSALLDLQTLTSYTTSYYKTLSETT